MLFAASICLAMCGAYAQVRPSQRTQRPSATPARPAYMQYLKAYEENPVVTKVVLKNGLTVLINEFKGAPLVAISTISRSGYSDEPPELSGISDLLAHSIFGKTSTRGAGVMAKEIRALGGEWGSSSGLESMRHDILVPSGQWKKALELEADAILNPLFDQDEIARAIDAVSRENRAWLGPADALGRRMLSRREISSRALEPARSRSADTLRGIGREKLMEYYKTCYGPSRLILVVSGDVTSSEILTEVVRHYVKMAPGTEKLARARGEQGQHSFQYSEMRGDLDRPRIMFGYRTVPVSSADYPALEVVRAILGMGEGSVIARRLRDQKKVCVGGAATQSAGMDAGYLSLQLEAESKDLDRCEIAALTEVELIKRQEPDDSEMERAQALLAHEYWDGLETVSGRAWTIGDFELLGDWKKMNGYLARIGQVKAADVVRAAQKYLRLDNCRLAEYLARGEEARNLTSEKALAVFEPLLEPAADQELAEREREVVPAVEMPKEGTPFKPSEVRSSFKTASILRGPDLFIREDHTLPLIHLGFFFPGGAAFEKGGSEGVTALMIDSMLRGTQDKAAYQLYRQLEIYGGRIIPVVARDYFGFRLSVLSANVEGALNMVSEIVTKPKFDDDEIGRRKLALLDLVRHEKASNRARARLLLDAALFKGHPYAQPLCGSEASLASLTASTVKDWYKATVEHKKPIVVMIGDTQGTTLASFFVRNFSGSRFQEIKLPEAYASPVAVRGKLQEEATGDAGYVLLGFQAPPFGDEDYYPVEVLVRYLGGEGGAVIDPVRAACGFECSLTVEYLPEERGALILAGTEVTPGGEEKVLKMLEDSLQKLPSAVIPYRDYRSAISRAVGLFSIEQQYRFTQIETIVKNILAGKGIDAIQEETQRLQEVKQDDLAEYAQRVLKLDKSVSVVIRGKTQESK